MNNVSYRFLHLVEDEKYRTIPARPGIQVMRTHEGDPVTFELCFPVVSAVLEAEEL